jgi:hypothetical protein
MRPSPTECIKPETVLTEKEEYLDVIPGSQETSRLTECARVYNGHNVSFHLASRAKRMSLKRLNVHIQNGGKVYVVYILVIARTMSREGVFPAKKVHSLRADSHIKAVCRRARQHVLPGTVIMSEMQPGQQQHGPQSRSHLLLCGVKLSNGKRYTQLFMDYVG